MGGGSKEQSSSQSASPWAGSVPLLAGVAATPGTVGPDGQMTGGSPVVNGVLPSSYNQFLNGQFTPEMQNVVNDASQWYQSQQQNTGNQQNYGNALLAGTNNAGIKPVDPIGGWGGVRGDAVDPTKAFASLGAVDPTAALQNQLSGSANNPYLDQQIAGLGTDISNNLTRNILPSIRSGAVDSGQYGGSRQGIAEGLAMSDANQQLTNAAANIRSGAYESAQNRQGTAAANLSNLGLSNSTNNANRDQTASAANASNTLDAMKFNANLQLQNNAQQITNSANNTQNYLAGSNIANAGQQSANALYQQQLANLGFGSGYNWANLGNFSNIVNAPGGGTAITTTSGGGGPSALQGAAGGAATGAAIGGPWGAAIGGGIGLLSSM